MHCKSSPSLERLACWAKKQAADLEMGEGCPFVYGQISEGNAADLL